MLSTLRMMIQISKKVLSLLKKISSVKALPISKIESFVKSDFDPRQICKIALTQSHYIWNFYVHDLLYAFIKHRGNALKLLENSKN